MDCSRLGGHTLGRRLTKCLFSNLMAHTELSHCARDNDNGHEIEVKKEEKNKLN